MRQLILTLDFPPVHDGGIARSMDETARALAEAGESVRVLTRGRGKGVAEHDASHPAQISRLPGHHWQKHHGLYLRVYLPFIGRKERGALVHTATWEIAPGVIRVAARYGWKTLIHAQGREIARMFGNEKDLERLRAVLGGADGVLPISAYVRDLVVKAGVDPARVHLVNPAVDVKRMQGGLRERFRAKHGLGAQPVLITLGRLIERKGQDTVIRAMPRILRDVPDLVYVVAGKGDYRPGLEELARATGVAERVKFVGFVSDAELPDAYAAADLYVMVSREGPESGDIEGFGITYLEANAAGVPVVAGKFGGALDAVEHGVSGELVDPNDVAAVGDVIAGLMKDRERMRAMGLTGRARVEREFTSAARARKLVGIAESLKPARG